MGRLRVGDLAKDGGDGGFQEGAGLLYLSARGWH